MIDEVTGEAPPEAVAESVPEASLSAAPVDPEASPVAPVAADGASVAEDGAGEAVQDTPANQPATAETAETAEPASDAPADAAAQRAPVVNAMEAPPGQRPRPRPAGAGQ